MLPSIPASEIVEVSPAVIGTGGTPLALNTLIFSDEALYPMKEYGSDTAVGDDYGFSSHQFKFAEIYFKGVVGATKSPESLFIAEYVTADEEAKLIGRSLRSMALAELQAVSGEITVSIDGVQKKGTVDFKTVTSFSDAATKIATALEADCAFNTQVQAFVVASKTKGAKSSLSFATGIAAEALGLTELGGASLDNVTVRDTVQSAMKRAQGYTLNFAPITYANEPQITEAIQKEFALWVSKQNSRYWFVQYGEEPTALMPNNTKCFGSWLKEVSADGVTSIYGTYEHAALACAYAASLNFDELNGRATMDFKRQAGAAPSVTDAEDAKALKSNGYAFYGAYATANDRFVFFRNAVVSGDFAWVDAYLNQGYFNAQIQLAFMTMLVSYKAIPYNTEGAAIHRAVVQDPINQMVNFGGIQSGVTLSEQQKNLINREAGFDAASQLYLAGYAVSIGQATAQVRGKRGSLPFKLWYTDGGSVHSVSIASINVQ